MQNWAGNYTYSSTQLHQPGSIEEIQALLHQYPRLKVLGTRHCFMSLDKILKCNVYCTSAEYFAAVNEVYVKFFPTDWPARMFVVVGPWAGRFDIEVDCIAFA